MADNTSIEWADASWNPIRARVKDDMVIRGREVPAGKWGYHCERISPGCKNCYAATMNKRMLPAWGTGLDYTVPNREKVDIFLDEEELLKPLNWKRPRRIFVESMSDLFASFVTDEMIDRVMAVAALCPHHTFLFLTKRADRCAAYWSTGPSHDFPGCSARYRDIINVADRFVRGRFPRTFSIAISDPQRFPFQNVHLGFSAEDQQRFDERWGHMRKLAAAGWKVWCSAEPLLGPITMHYMDRLHQVVVGGESGHGARPCNIDWIRSIVRQCRDAGVPAFVKQLGAKPYDCSGRTSDPYIWNLKNRKGGDIAEWPEDLRVREYPES